MYLYQSYKSLSVKSNGSHTFSFSTVYIYLKYKYKQLSGRALRMFTEYTLLLMCGFPLVIHESCNSSCFPFVGIYAGRHTTQLQHIPSTPGII